MRSGQQLGLCFVQQDLLMQGRALQGGGRGAALLWCWRNSSGEKQRDKGDLGRGRHEIHLRGKWCPWSPDCGAAQPQDTVLVQHKSWHHLLVSESPNSAADLVYSILHLV